jgi:hypothetical protein
MGAAATAPTRVRWNFQQTADLRQRPSETIMRRVHTEEVKGAMPGGEHQPRTDPGGS